jgi:glutathione peroxidase
MNCVSLTKMSLLKSRVLSFTLLLFGSIAFTPALTTAAVCPELLNERVTTLEGDSLDLCSLSGKVIMAVNTASYCGNTPQYEGLEALFKKFKNDGLIIIGFPSNDFGGQEPGSNEEIATFCAVNYGVTFPMTEKSRVVSAEANPFYKKLAAATGKRPTWNFHKYLISKNGNTVFSFPSSFGPNNSTLTSQIEKLLAE